MSGDISTFEGADTWVFDLDNTLYPSECDLFSQVDARMTAFVANLLNLEYDKARALQKSYYAEHGTTLNGLMTRHGVSPKRFLDFVHDIDYSPVSAAPALTRHIEALPGRKLIFTNGSRGHAERVLDRLGAAHAFEDVFDIEAANFAPKPDPKAYARMVAKHGVTPERAVFFEDIPRNLAPARDMGFRTVLVRTEKDWREEPEHVRPAGPGETHNHVDHAVDDLTDFLSRITGA